ncbi:MULTISPECIES: phosphatase domain-containing protein [Dactylosporangium]|uniref:Protein-tyrosine-phosphatase n=2 Tax=Dactylosporangium TaxID=35753 RepID=A0A9W6KP35_9ACTN|nr:protein-tyrosine-phosphatase [Dactylosporangium matsuzakiense]
MSAWMELPSGRRIRGRGLRERGEPVPPPQFGLYLLGKPPPPFAWESTWVRWPDFWLPTDREAAAAAFAAAWRRAEHEAVEVACGGGRGRTGTALACIAILDGVPAQEAVAYVRRHYYHGAVETPWQKRYVREFSSPS